ncbi:MAG TPA: class I SAM-dependent methyltransferase [Candidatus Saccharimonadales bacterium]|nr:class I SAM-dependent methyltransferase [Candidatus Saccharimonadales bacterium]
MLNLDMAYGYVYGMSKKAVHDYISSGCFPVKEVHPRNQPPLRHFYPDLVSVLIIPIAVLQGVDAAFWKSYRETDRANEDSSYYRNIDIAPFDIVRPVSELESLAEIATDLHGTTSAVARTGAHYPKPGSIDAINEAGYSEAAAEFTDDLRITTADFHKITRRFLTDKISQYAFDGGSCLEVGCGQGWLRREFEWPDVRYAAVDISAGMIKEMSRHCEGDRAVCATARALPFESGTFDLVFASLADPFCYPAALREIRRVIAESGHLVLTAPSAVWSGALRGNAEQQTTRFVLRGSREAEVYSFTYGLNELTSLLRLCGLDLIEARSLKGDSLPCGSQPSPALLTASDKSKTKLSDFDVVNAIVAAKSPSL